MPVMTGTRIFFVTALVEWHNELPYSRLAISPIYDFDNLPFRSIMAGLALYHIDTDPLAVTPELDSALVCPSTISADQLLMSAEMSEALDDLQMHRAESSLSTEMQPRSDEDVEEYHPDAERTQEEIEVRRLLRFFRVLCGGC
jgi:hypothetical protein